MEEFTRFCTRETTFVTCLFRSRQAPSENGFTIHGRICFQEDDYFSEVRQNCFDRIISPESDSIIL